MQIGGLLLARQVAGERPVLMSREVRDTAHVSRDEPGVAVEVIDADGGGLAGSPVEDRPHGEGDRQRPDDH